MLDRFLLVTVPPQFAIVPRFDWIAVDQLGPGAFRVNLGQQVLQGVLLHVPLALVATSLVEPDGRPGPLIGAQLAQMPWLDDGPGFVEGLPRFPADVSDASAVTFDTNGLPQGEAQYLSHNYGGSGGGASIRVDFGAEFEWMPRPHLYRMMQRWSWEVHRRPQRCYLTFEGEPLTRAAAPAGFTFAIGPTELMIPDHQQQSFGFDEPWILQNDFLYLGTIDQAARFALVRS